MALMYCRECGKQVSSEARACPHCGVPNPVFVAGHAQPPAYHAPQPPVYYAPPRPQRDPAVAALLSFFFPGAGQLYKGDVGAGIGWFIAVVIGYILFIVPGLILHIFCIVNAANRDG